MFGEFGRRSVVKHEQFKIGLEFWMSGNKWRCTDIGTRTIIAIRLDDVDSRIDRGDDPSWYNGPPYSIVEHALDEYDLPACSLEEKTK